MGLSIGILGLPNVGKSTTFNALTKTQNAQAANYPFCTIEPNSAIVSVMDERLEKIAKIVNPQKIQYSQVEFLDIAGLVKGASNGAGLGNQFLSNVRETQCLLHIVRCFESEDIVHVEGKVDPINDCQIIELELILSDIQSIDRKIEKLKKQLKASKEASALLNMSEEIKKHLEDGISLKLFKNNNTKEFLELDKELRFLSNKEMIYVANVDEDAIMQGGNEYSRLVEEYAKKNNSSFVTICSKLEMDIIDMDEKQAEEFLKELNPDAKSGLNQIISLGFKKLGLISYFTAGVKEVRSWSIKNGDSAPKAASVIHNDFERGFIKAEVISYEDFVKYNGENGARAAGALRVEGKDYIVKDGDIMHFRFNV